MIQLAVEEEIPRELAWLRGYDRALGQLEAAFDLPQKDISVLIRMIYSTPAPCPRTGASNMPICRLGVLDQIEALVRQAFNPDASQQPRG